YVVFTSNKLGFENFELFIVDVKGDHEPVRVTSTDGFDGLPVFSPNGRQLCWTSNRTSDKKSQLFLANWNHPAAVKALEDSPKRQRSSEELKRIEERVKALEKYLNEQQNEASPLPQAGGVIIHLKDNGVALTHEITAADLRAEVEWLADPARQGRMTGTPGSLAAADFLADYLQGSGLKSFGDTYFHPFEFNAGVKMLPGRNQLAILSAEKPAAFVEETDFRPLSFSESAEVEGEVVFAGYGLSVPEGNGGRYNSYEGLDVKDKVVLLFRYVPEGVEPQRRAQLNRYAGLRYKAMLARERGAKAVLFVAGPNSPQSGDLIPLAGDGALAGSGIVAHSISGKVAEALFAAAGKDLKGVQAGLDVENPHVEGAFPLPGIRVKLQAGIEHIKKSDRNVVAYVPSSVEPSSDGTSAEEYVIVGAHYDHLGTGTASSSMARSGEEGKVHPGADDNGSGVAIIMELAA
ncbi:MAG: M28 family peptidase, partial [Verrucomicrobiota bacterium]